MIRNLVIDNYRGFKHFELHELGRVNLLVGMNNSGKTTILEAIQLLASVGEPSVLREIVAQRGDRIANIDVEMGEMPVLPGAHRLFHGHDMVENGILSVDGANDDTGKKLVIRAVKAPRLKEQITASRRKSPLFPTFTEAFGLKMSWERSGSFEPIGEVEFGVDESVNYSKDPRFATPVIFVSSTSLSVDVCGRMFDEIALTDEEKLVVDALRIIEPRTNRIAVVKISDYEGSRWRRREIGSTIQFFVKVDGLLDRMPIDCMGDGTRRLLGLSLALVHAKGGILLVDEIDTGLHYTVMEKMWRMVNLTANRLNIQVFATTHSRDCYESLAAVCREDVTQGSQVTIQRIERDTARSIAYTEQQIVAVAERGLEVR